MVACDATVGYHKSSELINHQPFNTGKYNGDKELNIAMHVVLIHHYKHVVSRNPCFEGFEKSLKKSY